MVLGQFSLCLLIKELRPLIFKDNVVYVLLFCQCHCAVESRWQSLCSQWYFELYWLWITFISTVYVLCQSSSPVWNLKQCFLWSYLFIILCLYVSTWVCLFLVCVNFLILFCWIPGLCQWLRIFFFSCAYNFKFLFFMVSKYPVYFFLCILKFFMILAYLPIYFFHLWNLIYSLLLDLFYV